MVQLGFDARVVDPSQGYEPLPEGWYPVAITKSDVKSVKDNPNNKYLSLEMPVIDGAHKGATVFWNLNLWNSDPKTSDRAQRDLSAICYVVNVPVVGLSEELHGRPFLVKLIVSKNEQTGGNQNNVRGVKDMQGNDPGKAGQAQPAAPAQPPAGFGQPQPQPGQPGGQPWGQAQPAAPAAPALPAAPQGGWAQGAPAQPPAQPPQPGAGFVQPGQPQPGFAQPQAQPGAGGGFAQQGGAGATAPWTR